MRLQPCHWTGEGKPQSLLFSERDQLEILNLKYLISSQRMTIVKQFGCRTPKYWCIFKGRFINGLEAGAGIHARVRSGPLLGRSGCWWGGEGKGMWAVGPPAPPPRGGVIRGRWLLGVGCWLSPLPPTPPQLPTELPVQGTVCTLGYWHVNSGTRVTSRSHIYFSEAP